MQSNPEPTASGRVAQFADLPVRIGARIQLLFSRSGRADGHSSTLIGYFAHEFVIVTAPTESGLALKARNDEWLKVRLFNGVHLVEFDTLVRRQFAAPLSYWHLGYPEVVRVSTLRAAQRVPVDLTAHVAIEGQPSPAEARIVDLNENGARILAPVTLGAKESAIKVAFALPMRGGGDAVQLSVVASIRSVKVNEGAGVADQVHAHGVQFEALSEHEKIALQSFVLLRLNEVRADGA